MIETRDLTTPSPASPAMAVAECVWAFRSDLAAAVGTDLSVLDQEVVVDLVSAVEEISRMLPAVLQQPLVRQLEDRGVAADHGCRSTASYLQQLLRIRSSDAAARVRAAERFQPRTQVSGEVLPPKYPAVAAAMVAGSSRSSTGT